jgi:hypothetical protein
VQLKGYANSSQNDVADLLLASMPIVGKF